MTRLIDRAELAETRNLDLERMSIDELEDLRVELVVDVQGINAQLSDTNRTNEYGQRMGDHEWHTWRSRALYAKAAKERVLVRIKPLLRRLNVERMEQEREARRAEREARRAEREARRAEREERDQERTPPPLMVPGEVDVDDPISLLRAAHTILHNLVGDDVQLTPEENAIKEAMRAYVEAHDPLGTAS